MDLCNPNPCQQGAPCHIVEGRYVCSCPEGYYGSECVSFKKPCIGQHCPGNQTDIKLKISLKPCLTSISASMSAGAMSDTTHRGVSFYIILVGILALVTVCGCGACTFIFSHLHQKWKKQQAVPQEEGINNQREFVNLIRNVDRPVAVMPPDAPLTQPPAPAPISRCYEEIELTLPPSPAPSQNSPALKPAHVPKMDISNREREKLNRFQYTDNQELEA